MLIYLSSVLAGTADPLWPHIILLSVSIIAAFTVGAGILFESPKYSAAIQRLATWLVLGGIAVESLCTVFLFVFDERISGAQQSKIIALETEIAPRRILPTDCQEIAESMRSQSGRVEIDSYAADLEGGILAWQISTCLEASKTLVIDRRFASIMPIGGFGVGVFVSGPNEKLVEVIRKSLSQQGKIFVGNGKGVSAGNMSMAPQNAAPADAVVLVAIRPLPEMIKAATPP